MLLCPCFLAIYRGMHTPLNYMHVPLSTYSNPLQRHEHVPPPSPPTHPQSSDSACWSGMSHLTLSAAGEDDPQRENRTTQSNVSLRIVFYV